MLTLNQIRKKLIDYFIGHAQVNQVVYSDDFEFNAKRDLTYPVVNIEFLDANITEKLMSYNFKIVIGDIVVTDEPELQDEVISDALQIAEDFFTFLQYEEGWVFNRNTSIQKFLDDTHARVSGVVFRVVISVVRSQNDCATPSKLKEN